MAKLPKVSPGALEWVTPCGKDDQLLAAIISKLPPAGSEWGASDQAAWLRMIAMAFGIVYRCGEGGGQGLDLPDFLRPASVATAAPAAPAKPMPAGPAFFIDEAGIARRDGGEPITANEVIGVLFDKRGELGDLGAIQWADGTHGVRGLQLNISTSV